MKYEERESKPRQREIGRIQLLTLKDYGLEPYHTVLDIGCGSLRGGYWIAKFVSQGTYIGVEREQSAQTGQRCVEEYELKNVTVCVKDEIGDLKFDFGWSYGLFNHRNCNYIAELLHWAIPKCYRFFANYRGEPVPVDDMYGNQPSANQSTEVFVADMARLGIVVKPLGSIRDPSVQQLAEFSIAK